MQHFCRIVQGKQHRRFVVGNCFPRRPAKENYFSITSIDYEILHSAADQTSRRQLLWAFFRLNFHKIKQSLKSPTVNHKISLTNRTPLSVVLRLALGIHERSLPQSSFDDGYRLETGYFCASRAFSEKWRKRIDCFQFSAVSHFLFITKQPFLRNANFLFQIHIFSIQHSRTKIKVTSSSHNH